MNWKQTNGTGIIIVSPTRELSMQTYGVVSELMEDHGKLTHGLIMGGANRQAEAQRLVRGISVIVATPGRLLDHMQVRILKPSPKHLRNSRTPKDSFSTT